MLWAACTGLGALLLGRTFYGLGSFVYLYFIQQSKLHTYLGPDGRSYALVTGASAGIGLSIARALLQRGCNIILHSRSEEKLKRVTKQLREEFPDRDIVYVAADAMEPDDAIPKIVAAAEEVKSRGGVLTILVNNIGGQMLFDLPCFVPFADTPPDKIAASLRLNAMFPVLLTKALFSTLAANKPGLAITLGSFAGSHSPMLVSPYAISKALLHQFSRALFIENLYAASQVDSLGILVGTVKTAGNVTAQEPGFMSLTPEEMAESVLARVGCGYDLVCGNWKHAVIMNIVESLPESARRSVLAGEVLRLAAEEQGKLEKER